MISTNVDPWLVIGLAAYYENEMKTFEAEGHYAVAHHFCTMLTALQQLAGLITHKDETYYTFGPGNIEHFQNVGE